MTAVAGAVVLAGLTGCARDAKPSPSAADYAEQIGNAVSIDAMVNHLERLQDIADANDGTRATGTPGFEASAAFIADTLRDKGFEVTTPEFEMEIFRLTRAFLRVDGDSVDADAVAYTRGSPAKGSTGPLVVLPEGKSLGCTAADYAGVPARNAVVLVDRGDCFLIEKAQAAAAAGASALLIADNVDEEAFSGGMSAGDDSRIPVLSVSKSVGARLKGAPGRNATVVIDASITKETTHNVIAQTTTGATDNVVVAGAHLDSVPEGPGINDNGTGVAAILETALQMGSSPPVANAVRFAFWSGEEQGLFGSLAYVKSLDEEALKDIALYLNFDMIGSPNTCYFASDVDATDESEVELAEGTAALEHTLDSALEANGEEPEAVPFDARSDYDSFQQAGIPAGNFDTGADEVKTAAQVKEWGGTAGKPCDPNYHTAKDTLANVNREALTKTGHVVAYAIALYGQETPGANGIPVRDDRTREVPE